MELTMASIPRALFFSSAAQRVELARQRYFDEGQLPTGIVSNTVLESWARCRRLRLDTRERVEFDPVSISRAHLAKQRNHHLLEEWKTELAALESTLAGTGCSAMLTDATGVLIDATRSSRADEAITPIAHRVGVNLSEKCVGTTAPGLVAQTGKPITVLGGEHYFGRLMPMHCTAAPIRNIKGQLSGIIDISREGCSFDFDAPAVVSLYATLIENRLMIAQANEHLVLQMQLNSSLIDTPMVGLAGIDSNGHLAWTNGVGSRLLGLGPMGDEVGQVPVEQLFGIGLEKLLALPGTGAAPLRLANGLSVWMRASMRAPDGVRAHFRVSKTFDVPEIPVDPQRREPPTNTDEHDQAAQTSDSTRITELPKEEFSTLRDGDKDLILRTIRECGGNISTASKKLNVSRGLIYRRLRAIPKAGQS
jgi:sigma-54 dependent transcriptional regulator, acetoin dehydrogenase operon transcriptional activator AcoR